MKLKIRGAVLEQIGLLVPTPSPNRSPSPNWTCAAGRGELLVRVEAAGLCHSDLSVVDGNRVRPVPMLLGHEAAGVVEQVGAAAPIWRSGSGSS